MQPHDQQPQQNFDPFAQAQSNTNQQAYPQPQQASHHQAAMPAQHPAHGSENVKAVEHVSNPYIATTDGLVTILKTNPVAAMLSIVIGFIASLPLFILVLLTTPKGGEASPLNVILTFLWYLLLIPLIGGTSIAVASASSEEKKITTRQALRAAIQKTLPFVGLMLLTILITAGGMLLLVIPGLIVIARTSLAPLILFEENVGPIAAIKRSFALTKGHFFEMWGAIIASAFMTGGGLLSPATTVAPLLGRYQQYKSIEAGKTTANKVHWLNYFNFFAPVVIIGLIIVIVAAGVNSAQDRINDIQDQPTYSTPTDLYDNNSNQDYQYDFNSY